MGPQNSHFFDSFYEVDLDEAYCTYTDSEFWTSSEEEHTESDVNNLQISNIDGKLEEMKLSDKPQYDYYSEVDQNSDFTSESKKNCFLNHSLPSEMVEDSMEGGELIYRTNSFDTQYNYSSLEIACESETKKNCFLNHKIQFLFSEMIVGSIDEGEITNINNRKLVCYSYNDESSNNLVVMLKKIESLGLIMQENFHDNKYLYLINICISTIKKEDFDLILT